MSMISVSISQGLLWAVMAIGIFVTYRFLDIADLTAEGSFTLGAAVAATLITKGYNPFLGTALAIIAGVCAGVVTSIFHTKFKIPALLSGILTMTGLYSINLRVMGKSNLPFMRAETIITSISKYGVTERTASIIIGVICVAISIIFLWWFFNTEIGYAVRATGDNEDMIRALGVNTDSMKIIGLAIGNGLVAFSGAIVAQNQGYADIGMGIGTIVIGLASIIIGEVLFNNRNSHRIFVAIAIGSIIYRLITAFVISCGLNPNDLRLISSFMLAIILSLPVIKEKARRKEY